MDKYILVEWPEYQGLMEFPDFYTRCYFCAEHNVYFIPQDMYNLFAYSKKD